MARRSYEQELGIITRPVYVRVVETGRQRKIAVVIMDCGWSA